MENKKAPEGARKVNTTAMSFNSRIIAREVINIFAKHSISIQAIEIIFDAVREELAKQTVQEIYFKED